jgi:hypothetical protein
VDGLYNGFRGWMIDDIEIKKSPGTFPLFSDNDNSEDREDVEPYAAMIKMMKVTYQSPRWLDIPQR